MNKKAHHHQIIYLLTYLGSIPFVFFTILNILAIEYFFGYKTDFILVSYNVVILSFISGLNFSYGFKQHHYAKYFLIISNFIALIACYNLLITNYYSSYIMLLLSLQICLILDFLAYRAHIMQYWFFKLRIIITLIVSSCLIINIFCL